MDWITDGFALGGTYALLGLAAAYDRTAYGVVNVSLGDLTLLLLSACIAATSLARPTAATGLGPTETLVVLLLIPPAAWGARHALQNVLLSPARLPSAQGQILVSLGVALLCVAANTLLFDDGSQGSLEMGGLLDVGFGPVEDRHAFTLALALIGGASVAASNRYVSGRLYPLLTQNEPLTRTLRLPVARAERGNRLLAAALAALGTTAYFTKEAVQPTEGLMVTLIGFVLAAAARNRRSFVVFTALCFGFLEAFLASTRVLHGSLAWLNDERWARYLALFPLLIFLIGSPASREFLRTGRDT